MSYSKRSTITWLSTGVLCILLNLPLAISGGHPIHIFLTVVGIATVAMYSYDLGRSK